MASEHCEAWLFLQLVESQGTQPGVWNVQLRTMRLTGVRSDRQARNQADTQWFAPQLLAFAPNSVAPSFDMAALHDALQHAADLSAESLQQVQGPMIATPKLEAGLSSHRRLLLLPTGKARNFLSPV